jgi:hypothetical protein
MRGSHSSNELCFVGVDRRKVLKSGGISKTDSRSSPFAASLNAYSVFSNEAAVDVRWDVKLRGFLLSRYPNATAPSVETSASILAVSAYRSAVSRTIPLGYSRCLGANIGHAQVRFAFRSPENHGLEGNEKRDTLKYPFRGGLATVRSVPLFSFIIMGGRRAMSAPLKITRRQECGLRDRVGSDHKAACEREWQR